MSEKHFTVPLKDIIPQQHYLCQEKLDKVRLDFEKFDNPGKIYVIFYKDKIFSIDGHHRLFHLFELGIDYVEVINDPLDCECTLYQILADESISMGLKTIADLKSRILPTFKEFNDKWIKKCNEIV
ncbi:MAG: hypothetical protein N4A40_03785 [Tissierellales bacterium]|jgi:hypothetical protein|nr:hypothetical protein [Tissierellales bacterium]